MLKAPDRIVNSAGEWNRVHRGNAQKAELLAIRRHPASIGSLLTSVEAVLRNLGQEFTIKPISVGPLLARMYECRLKGYSAIGYELILGWREMRWVPNQVQTDSIEEEVGVARNTCGLRGLKVRYGSVGRAFCSPF